MSPDSLVRHADKPSKWMASGSQPTYTIAGGLEVRVPVQSAVEKLKNLVDDIVLVDDDALIEAMRLCVSALGLVLEPSGEAGLAAIRRHKLAGKRLVTILTGSNIHQLLAGIVGSPR